LFLIRGMHAWDGVESVRGSLFSQDRHMGSALQRRKRPLPWKRATGPQLVKFAYVVARWNN
jgi:hypothetical protein